LEATLELAFKYASEKFNELLDKIKSGKPITSEEPTSSCST